MRKYLLILTTVLVSVLAHGQNNNSDFKKITFGLGYNFSLESIDAYYAETIGISDYGFTFLDFYGSMNFLRYFNVNLGFNLSYFKDEQPQSQSVVSTNPTFAIWGSFDEETKLTSGGYYLSGGIKVPITYGISILGNVGYRGFSSTRKIPDCIDCTSWQVVRRHKSTFLQAGVGWQLSSEGDEPSFGQFHFLYSHYLDSFFNYSVTLGFTFLY